MTREEALFEAKNVLDEATANEDAVCYVTGDDREWLDMAIKALEQEPCEDCISRQAAIDALIDAENHAFNSYYKGLIKAHKIVADLPSVTLKPKTGHWITHEEKFNTLGIAVKGGVKCSECGYTTHNTLHMELGCPFKFCPNCGAKMIDLQESEDMEEIDFIQPKKTVGMLISIDVLDKIKSEIEHEKIQYPPSAGYYKAIMKVLQIIDKYKVESEE